jgi:hypothetical protein
MMGSFSCGLAVPPLDLRCYLVAKFDGGRGSFAMAGFLRENPLIDKLKKLPLDNSNKYDDEKPDQAPRLMGS